MSKTTAFCGLSCSTCPAFIATRENDDKRRREVALSWSTPEYPLKPEDINCDGCTTKDGRIISFVEACAIRKCGLQRSVENCAHCSDYPCPKLAPAHERSPEAKQALDSIRSRRK